MFNKKDTTFYSKLSEKVDIEVGDSKQNKFFPQIKFLKWGNDSNLSIRFLTDDEGSYYYEDDTIKWESTDKKISANVYPLIDSTSEDLIEFDVEFNEKPLNNEIKYSIRFKNVEFYKQEALTQEELNQGNFRPENVINSYAIYHISKRDNEYETGKCLHIYRPWIEDSNGTRVWCDLNIDESNELLSITIPQDFLDNATYPLKLDPTFGYASGGGSYTSMNSTGFPDFYNDAVGAVYTLSDKADISKITVYGASASIGQIVSCYGAIWNSSSAALEFEDGENSTSSTTPQWLDLTVSPEQILNAGDYYLGCSAGSSFSTSYNFRFYYDSASTNWRKDEGWTGSTLNADSSGSNNKYSVYATYTIHVDYPEITVTPSSRSWALYNPTAGQNPDAQSLVITNTGDSGTVLNWEATLDSTSIFILDTTSGIVYTGGDSDTIYVDVDMSKVDDYNNYSEYITFTDSTASNSPYQVQVSLTTTSLWTDTLNKKYLIDSTANIDINSDNFNDNSLDVGIWTNYDGDSGSGVSTVNEQNQRLELTGDTVTGTSSKANRFIYQTSQENLQITVKIVDYDVSPSGFYHNYRMGLSLSNSTSNPHNCGIFIYLENFQSSANLRDSNNHQTSIPSTPFWLRIKRIGTTVYFLYSSNGTEFTQLGTGTYSSSYQYVGLFCEIWNQFSSTQNTGYIYFDDFVNEDYSYPDVISCNEYTTIQVTEGNYMNRYKAVRKSDGTDKYIQITSNLSHSNSSGLRVIDGTDECVIITEFDASAP